jgi:hypothetical protein
MTTIATLTKYGLLDGRGEQIRVSDDAILLIVEERGAADRMAALRRTALRPELFKALVEQFEGSPLPTENAIKIRLEKLGFTSKAASSAARSYRETMAIVEEEGGAYNEPSAEEIGQEGSMTTAPIASTPQAPPSFLASAATPSAAGRQSSAQMLTPNADPGAVLFLQVPFKGTTLSVRIEASGQILTKAHIAKVAQYLKLAEDDLALPSEE